MLSLVRPNPDPRFANESKALLDTLRMELAAGPDPIPSEAFKGREIWSGGWRDGRHKRALVGAEPDYAKCAFCERLRTGRELDVEHYRPKAAVTRWIGNPSEISPQPPKEERIGTGYWWLAFEWSNYALSCKECNQTWKRNLFPVVEPRLLCAEGVEHCEVPLLLDPMSPFRTVDHFRWDERGYMFGVSERGTATIITCGLNRSALVTLRIKVIKAVDQELHDLRVCLALRAEERTRRTLANLRALGSERSEFAGMVRWRVEQQASVRWEDLATSE